MTVGNIQAFRDWNHVEDIVNGYMLLAEQAEPGSVYVQGSMTTISVLSYILYSISQLGYIINEIHSINNEQKKVKDPLKKADGEFGGIRIGSNTVDQMFLSETLEYNLDDKGLIINTDKMNFKIQFDPSKLRPSDVPILLANPKKIKQLGFFSEKDLTHIINDQINYYLNPDNREIVTDILP
jgi:GDPmannose 4,6-dehydratase